MKTVIETSLWGIHAGKKHYDQFDSRYKGLLPLRWVYVPEAIESHEQ